MAKKKTLKKNKKIVEKAVKTETVKPSEGSVAVKKTKIRVIGIGGGAGNIVSEIAFRLQAGEQPVKASFVAANTDLQALRATNRSITRFQFGESFTHGLGAGMNSELAIEAAEKEKEKIKKLFQGQDLCILVASLGGGTGSGAAPIFARIARNLGAITLGVFTLPFKFEGERKLEIAQSALERLKHNLNAISILPNERIFQIIDKDTPLKEAFSSINKNLAESLQGLIETIYLPGLINIDFADLKTILQGKGRLAFLNTVEVEGTGAGRVTEAVKKVLNCPLYPYTIRGARGALFNIAGEKELSLSDVSQVSRNISELVNSEAKIIFGISENKKYQDKIKVTLLATGISSKIFSEEANKPKRRILNKKIVKESLAGRNKKSQKSAKKTKKSRPVKKRPGISRPAKNKTPRKIKIKVSQTPKEKEALSNGGRPENYSNAAFPFQRDEAKIRKNAIQVKKEAEEMEKEFLAKEQTWEQPAFLRMKNFRNHFNQSSQPDEGNK